MHPEYVNRCCELLKKRYKKRREADRKAIDQKIVNRNTEIYTHVSKKSLANIKSSLDRFVESKMVNSNKLKK